MYNDQHGYYYTFTDTKNGDMQTRYSYVNSFISNPDNAYIGIGQTSPWLIDCVAPSVNSIHKYPLELIVKASVVKPCRKPVHDTDPTDIHKVNDISFIFIPEEDLVGIDEQGLLALNAKLIYIEVELPHISHKFSEFRHLCCLGSFTLKEGVASGASYYTKDDFIDYEPTYMENFSPIAVQNRVRQTLHVLMEI